MRTPPFSIVRLVFNVDRPPCDRQTFRQAVAYALDRRQIGERVAHGEVVVGNPGVIPPGSPWHNPAVTQYAYDPARARTLLDGRGYRAGGDGLRRTPEGQPVAIDFLADPAAADVDVIRVMLRAAGLDVHLITADPKTRTQYMQDRRFAMALTSHIGVGGDPDFLRTWYNGQVANAFAYGNVLHDAEYARLADQQVAELDVARRKALVDRMQAILADHDRLPTLALYHRPFYWLYDPAKWGRWFNTWGGIMDGIPLLDNKLAFL